MSKTKIELLGIKYNFGLGFLNLMIDSEGKKLNELSLLDDVVLMPLVIFYGRAYACERDNVAINFTKKDIINYIEDNGGLFGEFFETISIFYIKAMTKDVPVEDKKKAVKK